MASRLGDRLAWSVDVDEAVREQPLPPGLLLTLVENAVEHGISPSLSGGRIALRAWAEGPWCRIRVTDSAGRWPDPAQEGVGLRNSRDRLRHRFGEAARLHIGVVDGETQAELDLPRPPSAAPAADLGRAS
jgi:sensor histidine kinase YesM